MTATPTPFGCTIDGRKFVRADTDPGVCVYLDYAYADDMDPYSTRDTSGDPIAHAAIESDAGAITVYACAPTGETAVDPESGHPHPVHAWTNNGAPVDTELDARLDAALSDVGAQYDAWLAADARMGDPNP